MIPASDPPKSELGPLTSPNLGQHQSQPFPPSSSGLEQRQDTHESDSQSSSVDQPIESFWLAETERDLEENSGSGRVASTDSDSKENIGSDLNTDTECQPLTNKEAKMSVSAVRALLDRNNLHIEDAAAKERARALIKKANEIMDQRRHSSMEDSEAEAIKETMEFYSTINEKTMIVNLWQLLMNKTRFVKRVRDDGSQENLTAEEEAAAANWIETAWRQDSHLIGKWDADFHADTIPEISKTGEDILDSLLEQVPRVDKPKPDIAIGFHEKAFTRPVREIFEKYARSVTSDQFLTFQATEGKGPDGTIEEARNQCCRVGSAMSKNSHDFWKATDEFLNGPQSAQATSYPNPNAKSISFTLAVTPALAKMYVHWAEETGHVTQTWHQSEIRTYRMNVLGDIRELRFNLNNIWDWGYNSKLRKMTEQANKVAVMRATMSSPQKTAKDKAVKDLLESPSIKRPKKKQTVPQQ